MATDNPLSHVQSQLAVLQQLQALASNPAALAALIQSQVPQPQSQALQAALAAQAPPVVQVQDAQPTPAEPVMKPEHAMIIQFFEAFVLKEPDVAKQLVSNTGSFYRFVQSMVAKKEV